MLIFWLISDRMMEFEEQVMQESKLAGPGATEGPGGKMAVGAKDREVKVIEKGEVCQRTRTYTEPLASRVDDLSLEEKYELEEIRPRSKTLPGKKESKPSRSATNDGSPKRMSIDDHTIPKTIMRNDSIALDKTFQVDFRNESKVLVLYTGGTIGMVRNSAGVLVPQPDAIELRLRRIVTMHDEEYSRLRFSDVEGESGRLPLVLPSVPGKKRVVYTISEYRPLLDSSNMTMDDWIQVAKDIRKNYEQFDGFVILHGTDTLAYTSSALSFMLENLGKPVIVTGSQIPAFETRSDGRENLVGALIIAGNFCVPEVVVYFNHRLMRGNRTIKISANSLHAFESPNLAPLATVGIDISLDHKSLWRAGTIEALTVHDSLCRDVVLLRLFPSIRTETVRHFLAPPIRGVVLQCYGAGNMPSNRQDILAALAEATGRGVIVVTCTQCSSGAVSGIYETGKVLIDAGVIPGSDITPEAALTKLSYVLGKESWSLGERRRAMEVSLRGEMTVQYEAIDPRTQEVIFNKEHKLELVEEVARAMHLSSEEEMVGLREVLLPSLTCAVVALGDRGRLEALQGYGGDLSAGDHSGRTPLHVAAASGQRALVTWLLERGASVHARDAADQTPLMAAVTSGHLEVVRLLAVTGAHLGLSSGDLGIQLTSAAGQVMARRVLVVGGRADCLTRAGSSW
jgi:lysophospholipase